jgi:hypothetical protein
MLDFAAFVDSLQYMGYGLAGIFVIIGLMSLMVALLRKVFPVKK